MPEGFLKAAVLVVNKLASRDWSCEGNNRTALLGAASSARSWRYSTACGWCSHAETLTHAKRHKPARRRRHRTKPAKRSYVPSESLWGQKRCFVLVADRKREVHTRSSCVTVLATCRLHSRRDANHVASLLSHVASDSASHVVNSISRKMSHTHSHQAGGRRGAGSEALPGFVCIPVIGNHVTDALIMCCMCYDNYTGPDIGHFPLIGAAWSLNCSSYL